MSDQEVEFPGGNEGMKNWLIENTHYPDEARDLDIEGRVIVRFIVDKNGHVKNAAVMQFVHPALDREALRVMESMPDWKPKVVNGRPRESAFMLPITFTLE